MTESEGQGQHKASEEPSEPSGTAGDRSSSSTPGGKRSSGKKSEKGRQAQRG